METIHAIVRHKVGDKSSGVRTNDANVRYVPSTDSVDRVTVILSGPFDTEEIDTGFGPSLVEKECPFAGADFDMDRARTSEKPDKIDFAIQIFFFKRYGWIIFQNSGHKSDRARNIIYLNKIRIQGPYYTGKRPFLRSLICFFRFCRN